MNVKCWHFFRRKVRRSRDCLLYTSGDRLLRVVPKLGYNFKRKEFYWSINSDFDYWPRKRAALHVSVGNGCLLYTSRIEIGFEREGRFGFIVDVINFISHNLGQGVGYCHTVDLKIPPILGDSRLGS